MTTLPARLPISVPTLPRPAFRGFAAFGRGRRFAASAALACLCALTGRAQPATAGGHPLQTITLPSSLLAEDRRILIRLPRHYERDPTARYPVLYKLDGDNQLGRYDACIDTLSSLDAIPDLIVVAIPNGNGLRNRDLTPASLHQESEENGEMGTGPMGGGDRFLDFIEHELIPHVESKLRTTQERIFAGHSRGALLVLQSLLDRPGLFHARFLFSAPLTRDRERMIADTQTFLRSASGHASFLYCNWGEAENAGMNRSCEAMSALLSTEAPTGLRWIVERARGGDHQQTPIVALPSALAEYFADRSKMNPLPPRNRTARAASHPANVSP